MNDEDDEENETEDEFRLERLQDRIETIKDLTNDLAFDDCPDCVSLADKMFSLLNIEIYNLKEKIKEKRTNDTD